MKLKSGFALQTICGQSIVVASGIENIDFTKVISLNETAAFIWQLLEVGKATEEELVEGLCAEYEVTNEQAVVDIRAIVSQWAELGILEA
jgi:hypothetical protein